MDSNDLDQALLSQFALRFFCSVDITGSTAFKYESDGWPRIADDFLTQFPQKVRAAAGDVSTHLDVWKMLGDEVLFVSRLKSCKQAHDHLVAVQTACKKESQTLKRISPKLGLKITAWVAGFPVTNRQVEYDTQDINGKSFTTRDYVGPSLDLGFRLAKFATERKVVIDAGLARILNTVTGASSIYFDERAELKGVKELYPILWRDSEVDGLDDDHQFRNQNPLHRESLEDYLDQFFANSHVFTAPFIVDDTGHLVFGELDHDIVEALQGGNDEDAYGAQTASPPPEPESKKSDDAYHEVMRLLEKSVRGLLRTDGINNSDSDEFNAGCP